VIATTAAGAGGNSSATGSWGTGAAVAEPTRPAPLSLRSPLDFSVHDPPRQLA